MLRSNEYEHLQKNGFVMPRGGNICVTDELWSALMHKEENQEIVNSMKKKI